MADRITNAMLHNALTYATTRGRECGALRDGERIDTAVAWSMSYVCVYDAHGQMVRSLSRPMPKRGLFEFVNAFGDAWTMANVAVNGSR